MSDHSLGDARPAAPGVPCILMRGGTSGGPFRRPDDLAEHNRAAAGTGCGAGFK